MKLCDIAKDYRETEVIISKKLTGLRQAYRSTKDPDEKIRLKYRIGQYEQIYTHVRDIASLCENYYTKGYWHDFFGTQAKPIYRPKRRLR